VLNPQLEKKMRNTSKTLFAAGTVVLMAVGGAHAAEMSPSPSDSWAGFYAGLQGGYTWGDADTHSYWDDGSDAFSLTGFDVDGLSGGIFAGYNMGVGNGFVLGVEADASVVTADDKFFFDLGGGAGYGAKVEHNWDASLRLKAGLIARDFMPYLTGGIALGGVETYGWTTWGYQDRNKETLLGWTAGAGVEMKITQKIHGRLQYRYTDYGSDRWTIDKPNDTDTGKIDYSSHMITVGVSYRF
jgi:outer membrane immunogenic protein